MVLDAYEDKEFLEKNYNNDDFRKKIGIDENEISI